MQATYWTLVVALDFTLSVVMNSDPLKHPRRELAAAAKAIAGMRVAKSLDEFELEWRAYLNCIEKVWQKIENSCQHVKLTFQPWQGKFHRLRKKDMLLRYLKQARDADNHSIQDITKLQPGSRGYRFTNPKGGYASSTWRYETVKLFATKATRW